MLVSTRSKVIAILLLGLFAVVAYHQATRAPHPNQAPDILRQEIKKQVRNILNPQIRVQTTKGELGIELFADQSPNSVAAIKEYIAADVYDRVPFFSVVGENYIMAGQLPGQETTNRFIAQETSPYIHHRAKGVVGLYHPPNKPDEATNQLYITLGPQPARDGVYTIVGQVRTGLEILDQITQKDKILNIEILQ